MVELGMDLDAIIIGGGMAGLSAGLWCSDLGLRAVIVEAESEPGGQLLWTHNRIENYLAALTRNGRELRDLILPQIENSKAEIRTDVEAKRVNVLNKTVELSDGKILSAKAIIIATGVRRRKLNVEGEEEFAGRGMMVSGARDGESVRGQDVCVIGGGDAAFENALMLAEVARSVMLVHRSAQFRARKEFTEKVLSDPRITVITEAEVERIDGGKDELRVESVKIKTSTGQTLSMTAQAVLVRIGVEANTKILAGQVDIDHRGFVVVNRDCETSAKGIFAIGDVASPDSMTLNTAAGMGATAANAVLKALSDNHALKFSPKF